jgi:tetratricopeptide (TPR) repeat protein
MVWKFRGAEPAYELYVEGKRVADRFGNAFIGRHIDMAMMWMQFEHGAWDDTLRIADAFLASGTRAYTDYLAHMLRARILHARDDVAGAQAALDRALPVAREAGSPQALVPTLTAAVHIRADLGDESGARAALEEIIGLYRDGAVADPVLPALYARRLGLESELRDLFNGQPDSPLRVVVLAILDGEFARAADVIADAGDVVHEAAVRLHAAGSLAASGRRAEADEQLAKALAFFTAVDATRYIREGEALLVPAP